MDPQTRQRLIQEHLDEIARLQTQSASNGGASWPPRDYYTLFHIVVGMTLGFVGASASLLFNIAGSLLVGQNALKLVQVYLTFPMGEAAMKLDSRGDAGVVYFVGTCLYLTTGSLYGIVFHYIFSRYFDAASFAKKLAIGSALGVALWITNFYLILSWLQPLLLGGRWIVDSIPWWVGMLTHLVFAWTLVVCESWGRFEPAHPSVSNGASANPSGVQT